MAHTGLRGCAAFCHFMVFASAVIVTGIISYFLSKYNNRSSHIVYQEVIAVFSIPIYLIAMISPIFSSYEGYFLPVNFIFSYLWLTSFIFSADDWSGQLCRRAPLEFSRCALKRTVEAFNFIGFFFLLCNIFIEAWLMKECRKDARESSHVVTKERPSTAGTRDSDVSGAYAAPGPTPAVPAPQV